MAKSQLRIDAKRLRSEGRSLNDISRKLKVSKSSVSLWCRDVTLTEEQINLLQEKQIAGSYRGRLKGAKTQKLKRETEERELFQIGIADIAELSMREFFIAGVGIYWGEGLKTGGITGVVNSDPKLIKFMIKWFRKFCNAKTEDFICRVGINTTHAKRVKEVENYWSKITGIPLSQFTKTGLYKTANKKSYENPENHFGTLRVKIRKGSKIQRKIYGWIEGIYKAV